MKWYSCDIRKLSKEEYNTYYSLMSYEKQVRVDYLKNVDDKKRVIAGEMLARKAISEWCRVSCDEIAFELTSHGKPYANGLSVEFNIAHSGDMVVCAVDDRPVGIDVEKIRNIDLKVCKYICAEKELAYIFGTALDEYDFNQMPDNNMLIRFFEIWTSKEAYVKKIGVGIHNSLNLYDVTEDNFKSSITISNFKDYVIAICRTCEGVV